MDLRNTDRNRLTSLSWAAAEGSLEVFEWLLLDYGHDDLELSRDTDNNTLLHLLASVPSSQPTSLPYSSAFPPLPPSHVPTPTEQSRRSVQMTGLYHTLFPFLLDWSNSGGKTALHIAAQSGNTPFISLLLSYGADPDLTDLQGNSPLHYAAAWGHLDVARVLLEEGGASWGIRNFEGFSAGDYAYSDEVRQGLEGMWDGFRGMRRDMRRAEVLAELADGEMYEGSGSGRPGPGQGSAGGPIRGGCAGPGSRWRSGSESTAVSGVGSNGTGASGVSYTSGPNRGDSPSSASGGPPRIRGNSRNLPGPPVTQHPRRPSPKKGQSSPPAPDSGYATPRYDPSAPNGQGLSRSSSQSQLQTMLRTRSPYQSQGPTPAMSRRGSNQAGSGPNGNTSQRSSPVIPPPPALRAPLLAPQISITSQSPTSYFNQPISHENYRYGYETPSEQIYPPQSPARPTPGRSPWDGGGAGGPRTPARPTAAGPPIASAQMMVQTSSPALGSPVVAQEGMKRSASAHQGGGFGVGRGLLGGRI
ncbi:ankyrin repeat-containing domain protein [Dioszegia hungarica]|uniref:Ankyrin repeat-containing domain protein n=1 Tax=Dioszegia hungarica TaxID=4972 RepID=A0AA38H6V5_9TREE|nr:ankyrin repeat-containing domain protein [Dioszegia hungarica]KAI9635215.1 ankyrin repeat-containing domain protein [Dioszegia hungarica]